MVYTNSAVVVMAMAMLIYGSATDNYLGIIFKWSNKYLSYRQNVIDALS